MATKRYLLFLGQPPNAGGWNEFVGDFDSLIDALNTIECIECLWWHIVDTDTNTIVKAMHDNAA